MSSVITSNGVRSASARAGSPLPTRERRPGYVALAVVLIVGLAAVGAWLYTSAGAKIPVVVLVTEVPAGHPITRSDLSTLAVAGSVTAIAGGNLDSVIGQYAAVTLLPGMLLQRSMVTTDAGLDAGQAEVGVKVTSGQIPADGLRPGDTVRVLRLPGTAAASSDSEATAEQLVSRARVFAVRSDPAQAGGTLLTLSVPSENASVVAAASGAGQVALLRVSASS